MTHKISPTPTLPTYPLPNPEPGIRLHTFEYGILYMAHHIISSYAEFMYYENMKI